jgi:hypothetical protein
VGRLSNQLLSEAKAAVLLTVTGSISRSDTFLKWVLRPGCRSRKCQEKSFIKRNDRRNHLDSHFHFRTLRTFNRACNIFHSSKKVCKDSLMTSSRRDLFMLAGVASASALLPPSLIAYGDPKEPGNSVAWRSEVSAAVVDEVTLILATAIKTKSTEDFHAAAGASRILFRHLKETGYTDARQREFLTNGPAYPSPQWVDLLQNKFSEYGITRSREEITALLTPSSERLEVVVEHIRTSTLHGVLMEAAGALERAAGNISRSRAVTLDILDDTCRNLSLIADGLGVAAALNGIGCLLGALPACAIGAALALAAAVLMLAKDFICG